jgi:prepilin peptidase CpaA
MTASAAVAIGLGVFAVAEDLRRRQVPNWVTAVGAAAGLACAAQRGWHGLGIAAAGMVVGFLLLAPLHWRGGMGGGDVKLMAAFGVLLGPAGILVAAVLGAIFGALWAAGALWWNPRAATIPYAPAIVLGAWICLLGGVGRSGGG